MQKILPERRWHIWGVLLLHACEEWAFVGLPHTSVVREIPRKVHFMRHYYHFMLLDIYSVSSLHLSTFIVHCSFFHNLKQSTKLWSSSDNFSALHFMRQYYHFILLDIYSVSSLHLSTFIVNCSFFTIWNNQPSCGLVLTISQPFIRSSSFFRLSIFLKDQQCLLLCKEDLKGLWWWIN